MFLSDKIRIIQDAQKSGSLLGTNFSKMVKDTKMKLSHLKENRLTNYMIPNLWESFNRTGAAKCQQHLKNGLCATLLFAHVLEVQEPPRSRHI